MKCVGLILLLATLISFPSCDVKNIPGTPSVSENTADIIRNDKTENESVTGDVTVSPYAVSEILNPVDNHSWELTEKPEYVVLHFTSAVVLSKDDPFNLDTVRNIFTENSLGIQYIIDREGIIHCWIPETRAAWHAGKGTFADNEKYTNAMNKYSIGIEMLAIGSKKDTAQYLTSEEYDALNPEFIGFTDAQYESLGKLVRDICNRNGIPFDSEHIIGHDMYNPLKTDPGELFSYDRLFSE